MKNAVMFLITLGPKCFKWNILNLSGQRAMVLLGQL